VGLFDFLKRPDPSLRLKTAIEDVAGRLDSLQSAFGTMRRDWETVTAHVDQQTSKVHRELGHITKRQALDKPDEPVTDEVARRRRGRYAGGRGR